MASIQEDGPSNGQTLDTVAPTAEIATQSVPERPANPLRNPTVAGSLEKQMVEESEAEQATQLGNRLAMEIAGGLASGATKTYSPTIVRGPEGKFKVELNGTVKASGPAPWSTPSKTQIRIRQEEEGSPWKVQIKVHGDGDEPSSSVAAVDEPQAAEAPPPPPPPLVVLMVGGVGVGRQTLCAQAAIELGWRCLDLETAVEEAAEAGSPLGEAAATMLAEGKVLTLPLQLGLLREAIARGGRADGDETDGATPSGDGGDGGGDGEQEAVGGGGGPWLLDGWPRSLEAFEAFEAQVAPIAAVVQLEAEPACVEARLAERDGAAWDFFEGAERATGDEALRAQLAAHEASSSALLWHAQQHGDRLHIVDAGGPLEQSWPALEAVLTQVAAGSEAEADEGEEGAAPDVAALPIQKAVEGAPSGGGGATPPAAAAAAAPTAAASTSEQPTGGEDPSELVRQVSSAVTAEMQRMQEHAEARLRAQLAAELSASDERHKAQLLEVSHGEDVAKREATRRAEQAEARLAEKLLEEKLLDERLVREAALKADAQRRLVAVEKQLRDARQHAEEARRRAAAADDASRKHADSARAAQARQASLVGQLSKANARVAKLERDAHASAVGAKLATQARELAEAKAALAARGGAGGGGGVGDRSTLIHAAAVSPRPAGRLAGAGRGGGSGARRGAPTAPRMGSMAAGMAYGDESDDSLVGLAAVALQHLDAKVGAGRALAIEEHHALLVLAALLPPHFLPHPSAPPTAAPGNGANGGGYAMANDGVPSAAAAWEAKVAAAQAEEWHEQEAEQARLAERLASSTQQPQQSPDRDIGAPPPTACKPPMSLKPPPLRQAPPDGSEGGDDGATAAMAAATEMEGEGGDEFAYNGGYGAYDDDDDDAEYHALVNGGQVEYADPAQPLTPQPPGAGRAAYALSSPRPRPVSPRVTSHHADAYYYAQPWQPQEHPTSVLWDSAASVTARPASHHGAREMPSPAGANERPSTSGGRAQTARRAQPQPRAVYSSVAPGCDFMPGWMQDEVVAGVRRMKKPAAAGGGGGGGGAGGGGGGGGGAGGGGSGGGPSRPGTGGGSPRGVPSMLNGGHNPEVLSAQLFAAYQVSPPPELLQPGLCHFSRGGAVRSGGQRGVAPGSASEGRMLPLVT